MAEPKTESLLQEITELLAKITPGPWAWEWIAEKSNEWAVGQAWREDGTPIEGRLPEGEWLEDTIIERRLIGMNESGHANAADAEAIAALPRLLRHAHAEIEGLQREKARLTDFVKHRTHCALYRCGQCTSPIESDIHYVGTVDSHVVQPQTCDCGLTPLLEVVNARRL